MTAALKQCNMKFNFYLTPLVRVCLLAVLVSCGRLGEADLEKHSRLCIVFSGGSELLTKAYLNVPDTTEFHLTVTSSSGKCVFDGLYGDCPESLDVSPGSYLVRIVSEDFDAPAFDVPQFGDEQCVTVPSGGDVAVHLTCTQLNAGIRLFLDQSFKSYYGDAVLYLRSASGGLMYSFAEKRTAYFPPGPVSLLMSRGANDEILMVRELVSKDIVTLKLSAPVSGIGSSDYGISVEVDTARVWINEDLLVGGPSDAHDRQDALTVTDARNAVGQDDVWVSGYIVGGDLTSASASFSPPFKSMSNLLLGPRSSVSDRNSCLSVQLPDNEVREALNLVEHPELLGKRVLVKGDIVSTYFGLCGIKNTVEFKLY